ncbi:hypothetical protein BDV26DRAFT_290129 [Aspergillus bertholletiae]|uniref:Uncharacterized protein n=1 Tax=Aspergillus bertholletiae TaxID=1226010 RepID=A0A5N7BG04_9EURO|nr:hypothetical protein BDV26DRAFT_290129 [Aspergillus bertholletiae]
MSSLLVAFTKYYTIVRRNTISVSLPYGNPIPPMPLETKKFGPSEIFTERSSPRSNAAWEALAGPNHENPGFVYVPNWEELKLLPGGVIHGEMMYGISIFHQLHCLGAIRYTFWQLMENQA